MSPKRSNEGSVRKLPSGRFQARILDPRTNRHASIGQTFDTRTAAQKALRHALTERDLGSWSNPKDGSVHFERFADDWLEHRRPELSVRTHELYEGLLRNHLYPSLSRTPVNKITTATVRRWRNGLLSKGQPGLVTIAKAYRLLRTVLNGAVEQELIIKNPCTIKNAGVEKSAERPVCTVEDVFRLSDEICPEMRAMVLLATFAGLRFGELRALRRRSFNPLHRTVTVVDSVQELRKSADGQHRYLFKEPKSPAGRRTVTYPEAIAEAVENHLHCFVSAGADSIAFTPQTPKREQPISEGGFNRQWRKARTAARLEHLHFHDLRGTGNTLAAASGVSLKDLMVRLGHSSPRAALIYQHATAEQQQRIADGLSAAIIASQKPTASL